MPVLSDVARRKKISWFLQSIPKPADILEIGCGSGWVGEYLIKNGWQHYRGIDLVPPADIVGDVREWRALGLQPEMFDVIIAFEVVEHVDVYPACEALLKPGGRLLITTPLPHADWIMKMLESTGLNQKRTSPHSNLHYLQTEGDLELVDYRKIAGLSQWGIMEKTVKGAEK